MPQPAVDKRVRDGVFMMFAKEPPPTTKEIRKRLTSAADEAARVGKPWPFTVPAERTIRRLRKSYNDDLTDEDRSQYRQLKWPETLELGVAITGLPWDASASVLELLAFLQRRGRRRPTIRQAKWFWRITLAAPDAPLPSREFASWVLASDEAFGSPDEELRKVEWFLAFAYWRSVDNQKRYNAAIDEGNVPPPDVQGSFDGVAWMHEDLRDLTEFMEGEN